LVENWSFSSTAKAKRGVDVGPGSGVFVGDRRVDRGVTVGGSGVRVATGTGVGVAATVAVGVGGGVGDGVSLGVGDRVGTGVGVRGGRWVAVGSRSTAGTLLPRISPMPSAANVALRQNPIRNNTPNAIKTFVRFLS
jgi:hypothetical protein